MPRKPKKQEQPEDGTSGQASEKHDRTVDEVFRDAFPGGFTLRDEANAIVAYAFRNGPLEDLHAGKYSTLLQDRSLSRITDEEMKMLMIHACEKVEQLLRLRESNPEEYAPFIMSYAWRYCRRWER